MAIEYGDGTDSNEGRVIQRSDDYSALSRYTISNGSWHEVDSNFRCSLTPKAVGNIIRCTLVINPVLNGGEFGAIIPVMSWSGYNSALHGEQNGHSTSETYDTILGDNTDLSEMFRHNASYLFWPCTIIGRWTVTTANVTHTLKMYAQMGSGDIVLGDNTLQGYMSMEECEP